MHSSPVVLLALIFSFVIVLVWLNLRSKRIERREEREGCSEDIDRELAQLRDRVENLERIVTDDRYRLEREFDSLETAPKRSG